MKERNKNQNEDMLSSLKKKELQQSKQVKNYVNYFKIIQNVEKEDNMDNYYEESEDRDNNLQTQKFLVKDNKYYYIHYKLISRNEVRDNDHNDLHCLKDLFTVLNSPQNGNKTNNKNTNAFNINREKNLKIMKSNFSNKSENELKYQKFSFNPNMLTTQTKYSQTFS